MEKEAVVVLSNLPWDFPCDYIKQTSLELAKKAKVIVFSPTHTPTIRQKLARFLKGVRKEKKEDNGVLIYESIGLVPFQRFKIIRRVNLALNSSFFYVYYLFKYGFRKPILWTFSWYLAEVLPFFRWGKFLVYDRVDQAGSVDPVQDRKIKALDRQYLSSVDFVFVNSPYALNFVKNYNQNSFLVPCGCAIELFLNNKVSIPDDLIRIKKPVIGLVGSIDHRIDFSIIYPLVKKNPNWSLVFIGTPFTKDSAQHKKAKLDEWLGKLKVLPNVYFLGQKAKNEIPGYIKGFDVCLIPYDIDQEFVKGCNPMKLYEYLAMGKPVVSTPIAAVAQYSPTVGIASTSPGFEKQISRFLKEKKNIQEIEKRKKIALDNSWAKKVAIMWRTVVAR